MKITDLTRWNDVAQSESSDWDKRSKIFSHFIRSTDTVLDLGAGNQTLSKYLPTGSGYIPLDCVEVIPGTFVVDFNKEFRLPSDQFTIIVAAGFFEFITDLPSFLERLATACDGKVLLFSYLYWTPRTSRSLPEDKRMSFLGSRDECIALMSKYADNVREILPFKSQSIFSCTLNPRGSSSLQGVQNITDLIAHKKKRSRWQRLIGQFNPSPSARAET